MIDCPICHVPNDDDARFCAECGQRLQQPNPQPGPPPAVPPGTFTGAFNAINNPQAAAAPGVQPGQMPQPTPTAPQPQPEAAPPAAAVPQMHQPGPGNKLHSPLLGGAPPTPAAPLSSDNPELDRLRRMSKDSEDNQQTPSGEPDQGQSTPPRKLRSPLLAQEEFDEEPENFGGPQGSSGGSTFPHRQKSGPLRSPASGSQDENEPAATPGSGSTRGGKMRSPLLGGGGDSEYNDYPSDAPPSRGGLPGGKPKLRSRMLSGGGDYGSSGGDYYDEEDDPYADEDNPNVLRSPLLAAKRSTSSHVPGPSPTVPPQPAPSAQAPQPQAPQPVPQPMSGPVQPPLPQPQQPQAAMPQQPQAAMPQPPAPQPPAPQSSASSQGGWSGAGQPGGPPAPGPRPGDEPLQTDPGSNQPPAGRFQGTGTWYSDKGGTAGSDPQSLSGQQPNYPNNAAMGSGPLWNSSDTGISGQVHTSAPNVPSPGAGASAPTPNTPGPAGMINPGPGPANSGAPGGLGLGGPGLGNPAAMGGPGTPTAPTPSEYPVEDYSKLRRQPGEPTPANTVTAVPPPSKSTSGTGPLPHPGAGGFKDEADTARGGSKGESKPVKRTGSRLLSNVAEEGADEDAFTPANNRFNQRSGPPMPGASGESPTSSSAARIVLGAVVAVVLLMKGYAVFTFMGTQFWQFMPFVADQIAGLILLVGLLIYCFMPRN